MEDADRQNEDLQTFEQLVAEYDLDGHQIQKDVEDSRHYVEEFDAEVAHSLIVCDSPAEQEAVSHLLDHFQPIRYHGVRRYDTNRPASALLLGQVDRGLPVVIVLQPPYPDETNRRADMMLAGLKPLTNSHQTAHAALYRIQLFSYARYPRG